MPKFSSLERKFALLWLHGIRGSTELVCEHQFYPGRKWRFDFAHPQTKVAIELEGGIWSGGRHTRGKGFTQDCEKYNAAAIQGWRVFRLTSEMVNATELERISSFIRQQPILN